MAVENSAEVVAQNQLYWNTLAQHRRGQPVAFFRGGGSALDAHEVAAVGEVRGRRVLQLASSMGDESLTFAQMGAEVVAVDLAAAHLATGRGKARELGLPVTFIEGDMINLDPAIGDFDLVFISWGGICGAPDIDAWAKSVMPRLRPNGRLVISEHHPLWEVLAVSCPAELSVGGDYFTSARDGYADATKAPQITRAVGDPAVGCRSFVWNLGRVISAVLGAGLTVRSLEEFAEPDMYDGLGPLAADLPATYLLTATLPAHEDVLHG